jgi:signal transduction histidine kinase
VVATRTALGWRWSFREEVEMTDDAKQAWGDVGEKFTSWGRRVSDRYKESAHSDAEAEETTKELQRAAREVIDGLTRGVTAVSGTLRDHEATEELKAAVSALGDAITATVSEATDAIRSGKSEPAGDAGSGPDVSGSDAPETGDEPPAS